MKWVFIFLFLFLSGAVGAVEWKFLDAEHHLGGRKTSAGYLRGKVVLVYHWNPQEADSRTLLVRLEEIWQSFKSKSFVIIGSVQGDASCADEAKKFVADRAITFPIYANADLCVERAEAPKCPFLFVVDETGKVVYHGCEDRNATQAIVMALTDLESPRNVKQWQQFLDFELEMLPGRAYLRANEFRKKFPNEAKAYYEKFKKLTAIPDVKNLSELVAFARKAKDTRTFDPKKKFQKQKFIKMIDRAISKYGSLVESTDERVVQEAKNALADLKWTKASL